MQSFFVRGILIGLIFGVPAGVIGIMTIQRTLEKGFAAGLMTGFGSMAADLVYGCVGICGLTAISNLLLGQQMLIRLIGGGLIMVFWVVTLRKKGKLTQAELEENQQKPAYSRKKKTYLFLFGSSFLVAIMNLAAILSFLTAFASFGILEGVNASQGCELLCGMAIGTGSWWLFLSGMVSIFRSRVSVRIYEVMNRVLGILMMLFGFGAAAGAVMR